MEALRSIFGLCAVTPRLPAETDAIYPLHMLDDIKTIRVTICTWTLRFNDVLDADKLHASLSSLLEMGDWRKIGGRLALNEKGKVEIRVPERFKSAQPAVSYTYEDLAMEIADHPLAKTLPKATENLSIQPGADKFRPFAVSKDAPETLEDYFARDIPMLSLRVTSFSDATLVGLSWPHALMDVMGQKALLNAWSLVLAGRMSEVPPVLGAHEDAICAALDSDIKKEEFLLGRKQLNGWSMAKFVLNYTWQLLRTTTPEERMIFLPERAMAQLRCRAEEDLAIDDGTEKDKQFISDGDILTAWVSHAVARSLSRPRPLTVLHALNARFRLPSLIQAPGVFIQNMVIGAYTNLSPEVSTGPLGPIALENRHCLKEQVTEGQVLAFLRELNGLAKKTDDPSVLCGETNAALLSFTNWSRADIFKAADFGPAVVRAGETGPQRSNPPGTMVYQHGRSMRQIPGITNLVVVLGKDHGRNYWLSATLPPSTWDMIKEITTLT
ncbi:BCL5p [Fusarium proliferatum]|nr:BCL5p [Fusarium proliferatum]